jgi:hypothetical protein
MKKGTAKQNPDKKVMTYRNTNKRVTRLVKLGLLEEIKSDAYMVNIHGRKDFRVSKKGIKQLILYISDIELNYNFKLMPKIVEYLNTIGFGKDVKEDLAYILWRRFSMNIISLTEYLGRALNTWISFDIRPMEADERNLYHPINEYAKMSNLYTKLSVETDEWRKKRRALKQKGMIKDRQPLDKTHITTEAADSFRQTEEEMKEGAPGFPFPEIRKSSQSLPNFPETETIKHTPGRKKKQAS